MTKVMPGGMIGPITDTAAISEDEKSFILEYKPDVIIFEAIEWLADTICG